MHKCPDCPLVAILGVGGFGQASVGVGNPKKFEKLLKMYRRGPIGTYFKELK